MSQIADVDAVAVLTALDAHAGDPGALAAALAPFYDVKVMAHDAGRFAFDLWRNQQPHATVECDMLDADALSAMYAGTPSPVTRFDIAVRCPLPSDISRRSVCRLSLWDPEFQLEPFAEAAAGWIEARSGPLLPDDAVGFAERQHAAVGDGRAASLAWIAVGEEAELLISLTADHP